MPGELLGIFCNVEFLMLNDGVFCKERFETVPYGAIAHSQNQFMNWPCLPAGRSTVILLQFPSLLR